MPSSSHSSVSSSVAGTGPSPRFLAGLLGGFGCVALVVLFGSWGGYQRSRHTKAAAAAIERGDFKAAVAHLEYLTDRFPDAWIRQNQLGDALLELGDGKGAIAAFEASLAANPDQRLEARLGRAKFLIGDRTEAIRLLKAAIEKDANDPRANFYVALYYMDEGNFARAAFFFEAAGADPALLDRSRPYLEEIRQKLLGGPAPDTTSESP